MQCPKFICNKGYGVPLNVSNPKLRPILKDVLKEIIDIFDHPLYIHLGGDEVNMAQPCFDEGMKLIATTNLRALFAFTHLNFFF